MNSKQCSQCGFITFVAAELCKRCQGETFTEDSREYRSRVVTSPQRPRLSFGGLIRLMLIVLGVVLIAGACSISVVLVMDTPTIQRADHSLASVPPYQPPFISLPQSEAVSQRIQAARGLQLMMLEGELHNPTVRTSGPGETTLIITADNIVEDDCFMFAATTFGRAAELGGFERVICRNRHGDTWSMPLFPR